MILLRFIEDAYIAGRFAYFYKVAPKHLARPGFVQSEQKMPVKTRAKWAWDMTTGGMNGHR